MLFRIISILLLLTPNFNSLFAQFQAEKPGIHEFIFVDQAAYPTNLEIIKREIGYPVQALKAQVEGKVLCRILVDKTGKYIKHEIMRLGHPMLAEAVEKHIGKLSFEPAILKGEPMDFWLNLLFEFDLQQNPYKGLNKDNNRESLGLFTRGHKKAEKMLSRARSYYGEQNFVQARRLAWSSIYLNPSKKKARHEVSREILMGSWELYAQSESRLGNFEQAEGAFTEAIALGEELEEDHLHIRNHLPILYLARCRSRLEQKSYLPAFNDLYWVIKTNKNPRILAQAYLLKSMIHLHLKDPGQALNDAQNALDLFPYYCQAAWQKAQILSNIGAYEEACSVLHAFPPVYDEEKQQWRQISEECCIADAAQN